MAEFYQSMASVESPLPVGGRCHVNQLSRRVAVVYGIVFKDGGHRMGHRYPKRSQLKYTKQRYRVRNWPEYEAGLRKRGDLTLWFSEEAIAAWRAPTGEKPGGQPVHSDLAIEAALTVRLVYGLALRQTEGFLRAVSALLDSGLRIPDHSTLSRRSKDLDVRICPSAKKGPVHIIIDSTGLRVHSGNDSGSGPPPKRRAWRKLHVVVDADIRRSLVETAMSGYKANIGDSMRSRTIASQKVEATLACAIMNRMTQLRMPDGYCIA